MPGRKNQPQRGSRRWWRRVHQDVRVFVKLFPWRVAGIIAGGILLMAYGYRLAYNRAESPPISYVKAVFAIINISLLQLSYADMPPGPALDAFFVLVPLVGIPLFLLFGVNMIELVQVFFKRAERGQPWQEALAATTEAPIVLCGLGRVGYRIALQLLDLGESVTGIDATPTPLIQALIDQDMPVLIGDVRNEGLLRHAGVPRARAVIVCTNQDLVNLEAAFRVREINPQARIILRLFEDEIADALQPTANLEAILSRSAVAATAFAHAATGIQVLETFDLGESAYLLAELLLRNDSPLLGHTLTEIAASQDITVVCLHREHVLTIEPPGETLLRVGDELFIFAALEKLEALTEGHLLGNEPPEACRPIIVSGLGHTGYRVIQQLLALKRPVIGLTQKRDRLLEELQAHNVRVIVGDSRLPSALQEAGVEHAAALIACDEDDMRNIQTALRARELNPHIRVVARIFEEELGRQLQQTFNLDAVYSTSAIAAPAFLSAALNLHVAQPVETLGGRDYVIASLPIRQGSDLRGSAIGALHAQPEVTALLLIRDRAALIPPPLEARLKPGDELIVLASREQLRALTRRNQAGVKPEAH